MTAPVSDLQLDNLIAWFDCEDDELTSKGSQTLSALRELQSRRALMREVVEVLSNDMKGVLQVHEHDGHRRIDKRIDSLLSRIRALEEGK